jgi:hypothetical protein
VGGVRIDAHDAGDLKTEFHGRSRKGAKHPTTRAIDVNRDIVPCLGLILVENLGDLFDLFVVSGIRRPQNHKDSYPR